MNKFTILIEYGDSKASFQLYYKNVFQNSNLDWKIIYVLPRLKLRLKTSSISIQTLEKYLISK